MNWRLIGLAIVIAAAVGIVLMVFIGPILAGLKVPILTTVGAGLASWGWVIGVLAGAWFYLRGASAP